MAGRGSQVKRKRADDSLLPTKSKKQKKVSSPLPSPKLHNISSDKIDIDVRSDSSILYCDANDQNARSAHSLSVDLTYTSTASQTSTPIEDPNRCEELHISLDVSQRASDLVDRLMSLVDEEEGADETETDVPVDSTVKQTSALLQQTSEVQCTELPITSPIKHSSDAGERINSVSNFYGLNKKNKSPNRNLVLLKKQKASGNSKNIISHDEIYSEMHCRRPKRQIMQCSEIKSPETPIVHSSETNQGSSRVPFSNDLPNLYQTPTATRRLSNESLPPDHSGKSPLSVVYSFPLKEVTVAACVDVTSDIDKHVNGIKLTSKNRISNGKSGVININNDTVQQDPDSSQLIQDGKSHPTYVTSPLPQDLSNNQPQQTKSKKKNSSSVHVSKLSILEKTKNSLEIPDQIYTKGTSKNEILSLPGPNRGVSCALNNNSVSQQLDEFVLENNVAIISGTDTDPLSPSLNTSRNSRKIIDVVPQLSLSALAMKDISATRSKKQYKENFTALFQPSSYPSLGSGPIAPPCTGKKYVGAHVSAAGGIHKVFENAETIKASSFAMFMRNQRQWVAKPFEEQHLELYRQSVKGFPMHLILPHGSYLMNVGSSKPELLQKSRDLLKEELQRCNQLDIPHFNFHPGSCVGGSGREECCRTIAESINQAHRSVPRVIVVLENMCRQGNTIGGDFHELRRIIELVEDRSRVGVCLDTCHAHNAGYDLSTEDGFNEMVRDFDKIIGFEFLRGVHINDSKNAAGAHVDRHECIGKGHIGLEGMRRVMNCPHFDDMPIILETPYTDDAGYAREIKLLKGLIEAGVKTEEGDDVEGKAQLQGEGGQEVKSDVDDRAVNGKKKAVVNEKDKADVTGKDKADVNGKEEVAVATEMKSVVTKVEAATIGTKETVVNAKKKVVVSGKSESAVIDEENPAAIDTSAVTDKVERTTRRKLSVDKNMSVNKQKPSPTNKPVRLSKPAGRGRTPKQTLPIGDLKPGKVHSEAPAKSSAKHTVKIGSNKQKPEAKTVVTKPDNSVSENVRKRTVKSVVDNTKKPVNAETKSSPKGGAIKRKLVAKDNVGALDKRRKM